MGSAVHHRRPTQSLDLRPLQTLLARIADTYRPLEIWLFGSRARGDARPSSDWDLLVVIADDAKDEALDPVTAWRVQKGVGVYADVVPYRVSDFRADRDTVNTLAYSVGVEGVLIYEH